MDSLSVIHPAKCPSLKIQATSFINAHKVAMTTALIDYP